MKTKNSGSKSCCAKTSSCNNERSEASTQTCATGKTLFTPAVAELVAIGAAIASNCESCFKYHFNQAKKLGVSNEDMARAVTMANTVKSAPARNALELANRILGVSVSQEEAGAPPEGACCNAEKSSSKRCAK